MDEVSYIGELIWPGQVGHLLLLVSFFSTFLAAYAYFMDTRQKDAQWLRIANTAFSVQAWSMKIVVGIIFYLMITKHYEYSYVQAHVSDDLPFQYIFSAFWEGQEGSFMLWIFWHNILAWFIMSFKTKWVAPVLFYLSLIQIIIISMILGIHFQLGDWVYKLGSSPLTLLRETMDIPLFNKADYVSQLQGTGLNPLLQNYWMTIHPPVLFLGFASVSIPFCYVLGSLLIKDYSSWIRPTLRWGLFSASMLGIGILMGSAWAYEALSFGGYWAWDPVENTSLVPWLLLVAGIHTNLIAQSTKYASRSTYIFYILAFLMIIYSTTLTRSGVLGDTSVHAFTEIGLESQLFFFMTFFSLLGLFLFLRHRTRIPAPKEEESITSREFWMFVGSLVLLFSSVMINGASSLPIFNKIVQLFDPNYLGATIKDPVEYYNKYQLWVGVLLGLLSGFAVFMRYNERQNKRFITKSMKQIGLALAISIFVHIIAQMWLKLNMTKHHVLLFASIFTIVANLQYIISLGRLGKVHIYAVISHLGFGLLIIGAIASGVNQKILSENSFAFKGVMDDSRLGEVITLLKNRPMFMNNYWVTYESDTVIGNNKFYDLKFQRIDKSEQVVEEFKIRPNILYNNERTKVAANNPDTKHYLHKDIFTSVESLPRAQQDIKFAKEMEDTLKYIPHTITLGKTKLINGTEVTLKSLDFEPNHPDYKPEKNDIAMQAVIEVRDSIGNVSITKPATALRSNVVYKFHTHENNLHSRYRIEEASFDGLVIPNDKLNYKSAKLERGDKTKIDGHEIEFISLVPITEEAGFVLKGDVAVKAMIRVTAPNGATKVMQPKFIVRNNKIIPIRDYWWDQNVYVIISQINPDNGAAEIQFAHRSQDTQQIVLEIANNVPRQDLIAIKVVEFPGINLVWLGSIMMMLGLGLAVFKHYGKNKA